MTGFMKEDFLLHSETAKRLFFEVAQHQPIFDYHCHLSPKAIAEDEPFTDIARMWLEGDHYKWRIMRASGVPEELCAGTGPWEMKFEAYAMALTKAAGNPLLHWSHLELQRVFGIHDILRPDNAALIRERANQFLAEHRTSPRSLLQQFNVRVLCTTDDPADDLRWHRAIAEEQARGSGFATKVLPAFRPDRAMNASDIAAWNAYIDTLGVSADMEIVHWSDLRAALSQRHRYFHDAGCRLSDHALLVPPFAPAVDSVLDAVVVKARGGMPLSQLEQEQLATAVLQVVAELNSQRGWTMQLHIGALRNVNPSLHAAFGPDVGGDIISDAPIISPLASFLGMLEAEGALPRTILYTLDPTKHSALATLAGSFCGTKIFPVGEAALPRAAASGGSSIFQREAVQWGIPGKVQLGAAWWFNDQKEGMERHMREYASVGLLGAWVGMLTDSRSFLSFPRHEYFRRILCDIAGGWVESGELPDDPLYAQSLVRGICWENAVSYFGMIHAE